MSEQTQAPKVPGRSTSAEKPVEDKVADATASAADTAKDEVKGVRARFRAIRNDEEVREVMKDGKPFIAGAAIVAGMAVDPVITATILVNRVGRRIEKAYQHSKAAAAPTDES